MRRLPPVEVYRRPSGRIIADGIEWLDDEDIAEILTESRRLTAIAGFLLAERHPTRLQRLRRRLRS